MTVHEVLEREGISENEALREQATLVALTRISRYEAECKAFEAQYHSTLEAMLGKNASAKNTEDFKIDDDLMDWEFAATSLTWWQARAGELFNAA